MNPEKFNDVNGMPPQKDVITLDDAKTRIANFQAFVEPLYTPVNMPIPHGFVFPLADIMELSKNYENYGITGVRVYLTLDQFNPIKGPTNAITGILVPVTDGGVDSNGEKIFNDIIITVPAQVSPITPIQVYADSIYDVSRPCPPCCDLNSPLMENFEC